MNGIRNSVLFYPNIELQDTTSVKEALLLYDTIYRIVPNEVIPNDYHEIKEFIKEYDLIKGIDPRPYTKETMEKFQTKSKEWGAAGFDNEEIVKLTSIHESKVYHTLQKNFIEDKKLIANGNWFEGDEAFITNYMHFLSTEISDQNKLALITHNSPSFTTQEYMNYNGDFEDYGEFGHSRDNQNERALISLCIMDYIPDNIDEISFPNLVEFRETYRTERKNFLKEISTISDSLSQIREPSVFQDRLSSIQETMQDAVTDYRESCTQLKAKHFWGTKAATIPLLVPLTEMFIPIEPQVAAGFATVGIFFGGLLSYVSCENELEQIRKKNPYSYLDLLDQFDPFTVNDVKKIFISEMKEFVYD